MREPGEISQPIAPRLDKHAPPPIGGASTGPDALDCVAESWVAAAQDSLENS